MGVLTTAYSIPSDVMRKIQGYKKHLEKVFNADADWRFENYGFGKSWEEKIRIIGKCYPSTRNRLNHQKCWIYPDYDVWIVKPKEVQNGVIFRVVTDGVNMLRMLTAKRFPKNFMIITSATSKI
jgi:hypothetical protein